MIGKKNNKIYFPGLNALRFFAAMAVLISHINLIMTAFGIGHPLPKIVPELGSLGVYFFFSLSGFLITYLLLYEKQKNNHISIKKFYLRRILRIWPLYYLILIIGFFILPLFNQIDIHYLKSNFSNFYYHDLILYILILPNAAFAFFTATPHIGQAWSIGVEEQFYIIWPWFFRNKKNILKKIIITFFFIIILKIAFLVFFKLQNPNFILTGFKNLIAMSKFENMLIGGIFAILLFEKRKKYLKFIYNSITFYTSIILIPILVYVPNFIQDGIHIIYAVLFSIIILNILSKISSGSFLENKTLNYLGTISYGIYMYHLFIIAISCFLVKAFLYRENFYLNYFVVLFLSSFLTMVISHFSYKYFESPFLKLKEKNTRV